MKIKNISKLQSYLEKDLAWRKKEISIISQPAKNNTDMRTAIVLIYSHWEGFIKNSSKAYLSYISHKNLKNRELKDNFSCLSLGKKLRQHQSFNSFSSQMKIYNSSTAIHENIFKIKPDKVIKTQANLTTTVLKEIFSILGLEYSNTFALKEKLIDSQLLHYRNMIAHGERKYEPSDLLDSYKQIKAAILPLLDEFYKQVIEASETEAFLAQ